MIYARHRSASGPLDGEGWEFDRRHNRLLASVRQGGILLPLDVPICSYGLPVFGAHPIVRIDGETWTVHPCRLVREWPGGFEQLRAMASEIGDCLGRGTQLVLTNTPHNVDAELAGI